MHKPTFFTFTLSLSTLLALTSAQEQAPVENNITIAFFPNDENKACEDHDVSDALQLTTNTVPNDYTCFNVDEIFSQKNESGFQPEQLISNPDPDQNDGIHWAIRNLDKYDSKANYSRIWHKQVNGSYYGGAKAGKNGPLILWMYAWKNCHQLSGNTSDPDYPWFHSSCQTEETGECNTIPYSVQSFGLVRLRAEVEDCTAWTVDDANAARIQGRGLTLGLFMASILAV